MGSVATIIGKASHGFDYYVRSLTASALALGIVGAVVYDLVAHQHAPAVLVGWGGAIVGLYFGFHVSSGGRLQGAAIAADAARVATAAAKPSPSPASPPPAPPPLPPAA